MLMPVMTSLKRARYAFVMQATECTAEQAAEALMRSEHSAKLAILMLLSGVDARQGKSMLAKQQGFLRAAVQGKDHG